MPVYETESNDTLATATSLALGTTIEDQLVTWTDADYYAVTVGAAGVLSMTLEPVRNYDPRGYYSIRLTDSTGTVLAVYIDTTSPQPFHVNVSQAGTYYVGIDTSYSSYYYSYYSNPYVLTVNLTIGVSAAYENEPNNTLATANPLALGSTVSGQTTYYSDFDYYVVAVAGEGVLNLSFNQANSLSGQNYNLVQLEDANGLVLAAYSFSAPQTFHVGLSQAGTYYVHIGSAYGMTNINPYDLTVTQTPGSAAGYETEPNNTRETADTLALGATIEGQVSSWSDADYYAVTVGAEGVLDLQFDRSNTATYAGYYEIRLENSSGTVLASYKDSSDPQMFHVGVSQAGTYFVRIGYPLTGGSNKPYQLTVTQTVGSSAGYESESNDTKGTADPLTLGATITGQLASFTQDIDYYVVAVGAEGVLILNFDPAGPVGGGMYAELIVDDANGTQLADYYYTNSDPYLSSPQTFKVGISQAGTYYVRINGSFGSTYTLTATETEGSSAGYETESNNTRATADALALGSTIRGQMPSNDSADYYSVTVEAEGVLTLTFDGADNSSPDGYSIRCEDADGVVLAAYQTSASPNIFQIGISHTGIYYVAIGRSYSTGPYDLTVSHTSGSSAGFESESNGGRETADALPLGATIKGQLSSIEDVDYYSVAVEAEGILNVTFDQASLAWGSPYSIQLQDSNGAVLGCYRDSSDPLTFHIGVSQAGTYYIHIGPSSPYSGAPASPYDLTVTQTVGESAGYESESNGDRLSADTLSPGSTIVGQLASVTDIDYYAVTVATGGVLNVTLDRDSGVSSSKSYSIQLEDGNGTVLASYLDTSDPQTFHVAAPQAGTYFVRIGSSSSNAYYDNPYSLTVTETTGSWAGLETESNGSRETADALTLGATVEGQLSSRGDVDYYSITVTTEGILNLTFDRSSAAYSAGTYVIQLEDANGTILASYMDSSDPTTYHFGISQAGTYYVHIASTGPFYAPFFQDPYGLTITQTVGSSAGYESESNGTRETADPLALGAAIQGQLQLLAGSDVDYYAVTVGTGGVLNLTFNWENGPSISGNYYSIRLESGDGTVLASFNDWSVSPFSINVSGGGTYYVHIGSGGNSYDYSAKYGAPYDLAANFVAANNHSPSGAVSVTGNPAVGQTLTATNNLADSDGLGNITYQWQESSDGTHWTAISSGPTVSLGSSSLGHQVRAVAWYIDGQDTTENVASSPVLVMPTGDVMASTDTTSNLIIGDSVNSKIDVAADRDYFRVDLVAGTAYEFDLQGSSFNGSASLGDPYLKLRNGANMTLRADNDGASVYPTDGSGQSANSQIVFIAPESGSYYLDVSGNAGATGTYQLSATVLNTDYYVQSLLLQPNLRWNADQAIGTADNVTFSFPSSLPPEYPSDLLPGYAAFSAAQQAATRAALLKISSYAGITFTEVADQSGQIRFATSQQSGTAGFTAGDIEGEAFVRAEVILANNVASNADLRVGTRGWYVLLHEIEHALGLKHPGNYNGSGGTEDAPFLPASQDAIQFTIETYNDTDLWATTTTPMVFDVAALQYLYGANAATGAGNSNYALDAGMTYTVWDVSGNDTLDASTWTSSVTLDLNPGTVSYAGLIGVDTAPVPRVGIAFDCWIETAIGGSGNDEISGNPAANALQGGTGNDWLNGMSGNDVLTGGLGNDTLLGGDGNDMLDGGRGADRMEGGTGNDLYLVDHRFDQITELADSGIDNVSSRLSHVLADNVENLYLTGSVTLRGGGFFSRKTTTIDLNSDGTGNAFDNLLRGNRGHNQLDGLGGNDTLLGGSGADVLNGGTGADRLAGGAGADVFVFAAGDGGTSLAAADMLYDFEDGIDRIALAGGLDFADLSIAQGNGIDTATSNTVIGTSSGEYLAVLLSVSPASITALDFYTLGV